MNQFRTKKNVKVTAIQWFSGIAVPRCSEHQHSTKPEIRPQLTVPHPRFPGCNIAMEGDWVVTDSMGKMYVVDDDLFRATFEPDVGRP